MEQWTSSKLGRSMTRLYTVMSPCLLNLHAEYIMQNAKLDESQAGIQTARRNINNLRYADGTTLMAESEEELKNFLMRVKKETTKAGLELTIKRPRSWHQVPSLHGKQKEKKWKQWQIFFSWAPKSLWTVTAATEVKDGCSLEGKLWQT